MKKYTLYYDIKRKENNAGSKAVNDAFEIAKACGYEEVKLYTLKKNKTTIVNLLSGYIKLLFWSRKLKKNDIVFLQYPTNRVLLKRIYKRLKRKRVHIITLIHDIDFLRNVSLGNKGVDGMKALELFLLSQSNALICHNPNMIRKLKEENVSAQYVSLEIFDYLYSGENAIISEEKNKIIVAGNLLKKKAGYLYKLDDSVHEFNLALYGSNLDEGFNYSHAEHFGCFSPDELIGHLCGAFGLVWDGNALDCCDGNYGNYLKINNPHKVSLYIAAGLPVIVWKESALAEFISRHNLGIVIESLNQLDQVLKDIDHQYVTFQEGVEKLRNKIKTGYFLKKALLEAEKKVTDNNETR